MIRTVFSVFEQQHDFEKTVVFGIPCVLFELTIIT